MAFAAVSCAVDECLIAGRRITVRDCRINIRDIVADMVEGEERRVCRVVRIKAGQAMRDPSSARELSMADAGCVGDGEVVGVAFFFVFKFRVFSGPKGKSRDATFAQANFGLSKEHHHHSTSSSTPTSTSASPCPRSLSGGMNAGDDGFDGYGVTSGTASWPIAREEFG